jgi:hypothetical protein
MSKINKFERSLEIIGRPFGVKKVDCQVVYFSKGFDERSPRTIFLTYVYFTDGSDWNNSAERTGGDYRDDLDPFTLATFGEFVEEMRSR